MADLSNLANRELPPKSHNNPPSDVEILGESLTLKHVHIMRAAEGHVEMADKIPDHFTEEVEATWTTDFIKLMQNCTKELERRRKEEKEPFLRQGQYVDSFFGDFVTKVEAAIAKAKKPLDDWLKRKADAEHEARIADMKMIREQQAAALTQATAPKAGVEDVQKAISISHTLNIAEALAAQPVNSLARTKGKASSAGLVTKWKGSIKSVESIDTIKLRPYFTQTELQNALDRFVKQGGRDCEGCEIKEITEAKVK